MSLVISELGGQCPVQAVGTFDGIPFYFRSRGTRWSLEVDCQQAGLPPYSVGDYYGEWPSAGHMDDEEAREIIQTCYEQWRELGSCDSTSTS